MSSAEAATKMQPSLPTEMHTDRERRRMFLRYASRGWFAFGIMTLATLPFFPEYRAQFMFLAAAVLPTYGIVYILDRWQKERLAGIVFTLGVNYGFYGLFLMLAIQEGPSHAFSTEATVWMLMGLAILFAGALIERWAAPVTALVNTALLIATRMTLAPQSDPRPSAPVFWWMLALAVWLYETTLGQSLARAWNELADRRKAEARFADSEKRFRSLSSIERALSETERVGIETILQLIVDSAKALIPGTGYAVLHLIDDRGEYLVPRAVAGLGDKSKKTLHMRVGQGIAGQAIETRQVIEVSDTRTDPRFLSRTAPAPYRSMVVAPIQSNDRCFGTISIQGEQPGAFSAEDGQLLGALGNQAAIAIENTNLLETTRQDLKEINALYRVNQGLAASLDPDQLMKDVVELLHTDFGFYHVQIYDLNPIDQSLIAAYGSGEIGRQLREQHYRLPLGAGVAGHVAATAKPFTAHNVEDAIFFVRNPLLPDTQSELAIPIKVDGQVHGVLDIQQSLPSRLTAREVKLMEAVADQLAVALQKAKLYTHLQESLQQEKAMRAQLMQSERLALVGRLLASVSHELNNPIQAIQNALFLIKEEENLSQQGRQDLGIVLSETERISALINRLRSAYRPSRSEDLQGVQLNKVVEDVQLLTASHMRRQDIHFEFQPDPVLPTVPGIPDQLRQVVLNLFMNAIEAMPSGGCLTVATRNLVQQNKVLLSFSDTGIGIDPKILPHIFEPFVSDKESGTGLGLTITYDIIQQHRGELRAENNAHGGATFRVWLPVKREA